MTAPGDEPELLRVSVELWHPGCWGIESTDGTGACVVGHGATIDGTVSYERCTVYGDSPEHVEQAIGAAHDSSFIESIRVLDDDPRNRSHPRFMGAAATDVFIGYEADDGIGPAFLSRGFLLDSYYRVEDGTETWQLLVAASRTEIERTLDTICDERDAEITLRRLSPAERSEPPSPGDDRGVDLTPRQRDAIALARRRGYYEWPREVTAGELATETGVAKATFLEHLRKAEAKLLDSSNALSRIFGE